MNHTLLAAAFSTALSLTCASTATGPACHDPDRWPPGAGAEGDEPRRDARAGRATPRPTDGDLIKHDNTEVTSVVPRSVRNRLAPRLYFEGTCNGRTEQLWTDGRTTGAGAPTGGVFQPAARYEFFFAGNELLVKRHPSPTGFSDTVALIDAGVAHTPVPEAPPARIEHFDLRADPSKPNGWLVLVANTKKPGDARPTKRIYRIDTALLEAKLGSAQLVSHGGGIAADVEAVDVKRTADDGWVLEFEATWPTPAGERKRGRLQTAGEPVALAAGGNSDAATTPPAKFRFDAADGRVRVTEIGPKGAGPARSGVLVLAEPDGAQSRLHEVRSVDASYQLDGATLLVVTGRALGSDAPPARRLWTVVTAELEQLLPAARAR